MSYVVRRLSRALNDEGKALKGSRVLVLGLAYKANIDDDRESPSYEIIEMLKDAGARVEYCDPLFPEARKTRKHDLQMRSVACTQAAFAEFDAIVVSTAHEVFRDARLFEGVPLVVDTRNLVAPLLGADRPGPRRLVKA